MSRSEGYLFGVDGQILLAEEYRNGWGTAPLIWDYLARKYANAPHWLRVVERFWAPLGSPDRIEIGDADDRLLLHLTFDAVLLPRDEFVRAADIVEHRLLPTVPENYANHWPAIIGLWRRYRTDPLVLGWGLYATSVSDNPWFDSEAQKWHDPRRALVIRHGKRSEELAVEPRTDPEFGIRDGISDLERNLAETDPDSRWETVEVASTGSDETPVPAAVDDALPEEARTVMNTYTLNESDLGEYEVLNPPAFNDRRNAELGIGLTDRGFLRAEPVPSTYGGVAEVYESSAADPRIWVRVECPVDLNDPSSPTKYAVAHLDIQNAIRLRDQLTWIIDHHFLGGEE
jgi:hypothetical protein